MRGLKQPTQHRLVGSREMFPDELHQQREEDPLVSVEVDPPTAGEEVARDEPRGFQLDLITLS